jgi:outer membrane protein OmpA-like peptidoglycan-associated protein
VSCDRRHHCHSGCRGGGLPRRSSNLTAAGFGENRPVTSNATASGKAKNRRIVLRVTATEL